MAHDLSSNGPPLQGQILLAVPSMRDPNFARAVIYMAAHTDDQGAFGYILNRPLDQRVTDLMPDQELGALGEVPVFVGGPVATDKMAFASLSWNRGEKVLEMSTHLSVNDAQHELSLGHQVRGFVGYSGWSEGQLEKEMDHRAWIATSPDKAVLTHRESGTLWGRLLSDMGPLFSLIAKTPEDVSLN